MSKLNPSQRRRMVNDAIGMAFDKKQKTSTDLAYDKAKQTTEMVQRVIKPILQAGGWTDKQALRQTIAKLYLESFDQYTKEELILIVSGMHLEIMMETIEKAPYGGKPDLLS